MKISVAQTRPIKGDVSANTVIHKKLIDLAIIQNANAIFFPELSLTGYEPKLAERLARKLDDAIFDKFQEIADNSSITIGLGMPIKTPEGIHIDMIIFQPYLPRQRYSKQQLHSDELPYFVPGEKQIILNIDNKRIAPAICYESLLPEHSTNACKLGAEIYVASAAKAQTGIHKAMIHYPAVAKKFSMPVLMANCVGVCDDFESVGKTAAWNKEGMLVGQLDNKQVGILIFDTETEEFTKHILK